MAEVRITDEALEQLEALPVAVQVRIQGIIRRLARWPQVSGAKPLRKELAGKFRCRTGDYRVQFDVIGDVVTIEKVGHRDGFYED